ncbi:LptA/OstA family protein [Xanthobacter oligotrophicus]|uniref:LptA/OstA family protein n=1 Tax=Xanthobacter oligotrophicus TaxID=2607286 RepID=UPI0011F197B5|nr:LptA/OstA family protein [Xanthobacter oligotrophicus]MCG5235152.1 organic solvent tolerance protein OstA [Xanthobacter oligotrophicus]
MIRQSQDRTGLAFRARRLAQVAAAAMLVAAPGAALLGVSTSSTAAAQTSNVPNALQGFAKNRDQPVRINADSLEVRDKDKVAVFSGNVLVTQGDTTLRSKDLMVYYEGSVAQQAGGQPAGEQATGVDPSQKGQIRKLEAVGGVVVKTKEQTATGDSGVFEMKTNTVTLVGKPVVLTQGPNVIRGQKLVVDLVSGVSKFEGGRVESLIVPGSLKQDTLPKPADQGGQAPRR